MSLLDLGATLEELAGVGSPGGRTAAEAVVTSAAGVSEQAVAEGRTGLSLLESVRWETSGTSGPDDRDVVIEYLAEGIYRPQLTLVRGQHKYILCPGDPDQLFDLVVDPDELENKAWDPEYAEVAGQMRTELEGRYDRGELESVVLASQDRRRLVAGALQSGSSRPWDFAPEPQQRVCARRLLGCAVVRADQGWVAVAEHNSSRQVAPESGCGSAPCAGVIWAARV